MGEAKSDNPLDGEIKRMKSSLGQLEQKVNRFMNTFTGLPAKERALLLNEIQVSFRQIGVFIDSFPLATQFNAGTRFSFDNLKQSFGTLVGRWRKFEATM
jgi:hypothetical protein